MSWAPSSRLPGARFPASCVKLCCRFGGRTPTSLLLVVRQSTPASSKSKPKSKFIDLRFSIFSLSVPSPSTSDGQRDDIATLFVAIADRSALSLAFSPRSVRQRPPVALSFSTLSCCLCYASSSKRQLQHGPAAIGAIGPLSSRRLACLYDDFISLRIAVIAAEKMPWLPSRTNARTLPSHPPNSLRLSVQQHAQQQQQSPLAAPLAGGS